jgi:hypothetical protein
MSKASEGTKGIKLTKREEIIFREINSVKNYQKLIGEHLLSLERLLWQVLVHIGKPENGNPELDLRGRFEPVEPVGKPR